MRIPEWIEVEPFNLDSPPDAIRGNGTDYAIAPGVEVRLDDGQDWMVGQVNGNCGQCNCCQKYGPAVAYRDWRPMLKADQ